MAKLQQKPVRESKQLNSLTSPSMTNAIDEMKGVVEQNVSSSFSLAKAGRKPGQDVEVFGSTQKSGGQGEEDVGPYPGIRV